MSTWQNIYQSVLTINVGNLEFLKKYQVSLENNLKIGCHS